MSSIFIVGMVLVSFLVGLAFGFIVSKRKSKSYDGSLQISESDASVIYQLEIDTPPELLKDRESIVFKVVKNKDEILPSGIAEET